MEREDEGEGGILWTCNFSFRKNPGPRLPLGMKSEAVCMGICIYVLYFSSSFVQMAEITTHLHTAHLQMKTVHNQRTRRIPVVLHSPHNR